MAFRPGIPKIWPSQRPSGSIQVAEASRWASCQGDDDLVGEEEPPGRQPPSPVLFDGIAGGAEFFEELLQRGKVHTEHPPVFAALNAKAGAEPQHEVFPRPLPQRDRFAFLQHRRAAEHALHIAPGGPAGR